MDVINQLRAMGLSDDGISRATCNGLPLASVKGVVKQSEGWPAFRNKTEAAYWHELENLKRVGLVEAFWYEPIRLRLAANTTYTPDYLVVYANDKLTFVEIKGRKFPAGQVKFKVAREMYGKLFRFVMLERKAGTWKEIM